MTEPYFSDPHKQALLEKLARGKCSAGMCSLGPDKGFVTRWRPKVSGEFVRNSDDPDDGFPLRVDAIAAAQRYRDSCRDALAQANGDL